MKKKIIIIIIAAVVVLAGVLCAIFLLPHNGGDKPGETTGTEAPADTSAAPVVTESEETDPPIEIVTDDPEDVSLLIAENVRLVRTFSYTGLYVEDGSDEIVEKIVAVNVKNSGNKAVQYLAFTLKGSDGKDYVFEVTTLLPGDSVTVLEKNRASYDKDVTYEVSGCDSCAYFTETPSLCSDVIAVTANGHNITVKNLTDKTIASCRVYYKNVNGDSLIGGITYTVGYENLEPGQELTAVSKHFDGDSSKIMFLTYAEQ